MLYLLIISFLFVALYLSVSLAYWLDFLLTINFLSLSGNNWILVLEFDNFTAGVLLMLGICFSYVLFYTSHYFSGDTPGKELNKIICLFVGVMASLVCTGDFLLTLIFWEYLGVVSFFLILFYSSCLSLRSSIVTLVSSRFGDVCLFIIIGLSGYIFNCSLLSLVMILLIIFTKSAVFPFTSWLLEAMRAPTPVSSLVHSSTLVAAGVWFAMRYDFLLFIDNSFYFSVFLLITIFITGVSCFFFLDLKKIVALSTCNNISWCILYLIFGDCILSLFQLVSHGVSKCMLFILIGDVMSGAGGSQNSNCVYSPVLYGNWNVFGLFSVILGLSGIPFIGIFYTKHFLLASFMGISNLLLGASVLFCMFLSYLYSFRFCGILLNTKTAIVSGNLYSFNAGGIIYIWLAINFFLCLTLDETVTLGWLGSIALIGFQLISCVVAWNLYNSIFFSTWSSSLFGTDNVVEFVYGTFWAALSVISMFLYRWDKSMLSLFNGAGNISLSLYTTNSLNIIIISILLFLVCYIII
uniref:NADH dehydrogenase subunit 5 n=1 Tax=Mosgovoyia sp. SQ20 TaxID=2854040 RepID=UPI001F140F27|nr:NADH dehydrogenase subunit 5 [Mosgovoyia sp. SQ20]UKS08009.1 NADH dehydrogenase subunit 5 [Mosgovoyia sp. SQ20]